MPWPGGDGLATVVPVPAAHYPDGYAVEVTGAPVTSGPCAETLTLRNQPHAAQVTLRVIPATCRR